MGRSELIDVLKGCAIILVVVGHSIQYGYGSDYFEKEVFYDNFIFRAIYTFHMPLFMFISGYLFVHSSQKKFIYVIYNKIKYIGIPYVVYYSFLYLLWWHSYQLDVLYFSDYLRKFIGQVWLWFLSSLMLNCFLISFSYHLLGKKMSIWASMLLVCIFFLVPNSIIPDTHKYMFTFFSLGYYCNKYVRQFAKKLIELKICFYLFLIYLLSLFFYNKDYMIYEGGYCVMNNNHLVVQQLTIDMVRYLVAIFATCFFVCFVNIFVMKIRLLCNFLSILGRYTLAIYCMQSVFFVFISINFDKIFFLGKNIPYVWPFVLCCVVLTFCGILIICFKRNKFTKLCFLGK